MNFKEIGEIRRRVRRDRSNMTEILAPAGVQQGHVQHHDVHALLLSQDAPMILQFSIISAETVYALDKEQIVFS